MRRLLASAGTLVVVSVAAAAQTPPKNIWAGQYKTRSGEAMAAQFDSDRRPVYRYRVAIAGLLQLKAGMTAAEIGAAAGLPARVMAALVAPSGRVIATELDPKMVAYMNVRAKAEGLANFTAIPGIARSQRPGARVDAVSLVNTASFFDRPEAMLHSIAPALKPVGVLLVVDFPREGLGARQQGIDADEVVALATAAGFKRELQSGIVPGHDAIRSRKP